MTICNYMKFGGPSRKQHIPGCHPGFREKQCVFLCQKIGKPVIPVLRSYVTVHFNGLSQKYIFFTNYRWCASQTRIQPAPRGLNFIFLKIILFFPQNVYICLQTILMTITINLTDAEVKGLKSYLKEVDDVKANKAYIQQHIQNIVTSALHNPHEAVSDHINQFQSR